MIKKYMNILFINLCILAFPIMVFATNEYTDSITNVSFSIPNEWQETSLTKEREIIKKKYIPISNDGSSILFGYSDLWETIPENEKSGLKHSDLKHSEFSKYLTSAQIENMLGISNESPDTNNIAYNGIEYIEVKYNTQISVFNVSEKVTMIFLLRFENGYMYMFGYCDFLSQTHYQEFINMVNSVKYPKTDVKLNSLLNYDSNGNLQFNWLNLIISIILTIAVYSLPIIIYRYVILKDYLSSSKAKKITIIYGLVAFFVMAILKSGAPGAAIILWSFINYRMLITPSKNDVGLRFRPQSDKVSKGIIIDDLSNSANADIPIFEDTKLEEMIETEEQSKIQETNDVCTKEIVFCRKCGNKLPENAMFCHKCGTKISED